MADKAQPVETPLSGVRVVNIGSGWAGRVAAMLLADPVLAAVSYRLTKVTPGGVVAWHCYRTAQHGNVLQGRMFLEPWRCIRFFRRHKISPPFGLAVSIAGA